MNFLSVKSLPQQVGNVKRKYHKKEIIIIRFLEPRLTHQACILVVIARAYS